MARSAPCHFVGDAATAISNARELAGDRIVEVSAGDVGGQVFALGLVNEIRMVAVPVVFGAGKRSFGSAPARRLREDPVDVIHGEQVMHVRYAVRT